MILQVSALVLIALNLYLILRSKAERVVVALIWCASMILLGIHCAMEGPTFLATFFFICALFEALFAVFGGEDDNGSGCC